MTDETGTRKEMERILSDYAKSRDIQCFFKKTKQKYGLSFYFGAVARFKGFVRVPDPHLRLTKSEDPLLEKWTWLVGYDEMETVLEKLTRQKRFPWN